MSPYYCTLSVSLLNPLNGRKATFYPVVASRLNERAIVGQNTTEAVDVLWVSTGFLVGVIDMAVVL
jgi:hypothetical protein